MDLLNGMWTAGLFMYFLHQGNAREARFDPAPHRIRSSSRTPPDEYAGFNELPYAINVVGAQIVEDNDVARPKKRPELVLQK